MEYTCYIYSLSVRVCTAMTKRREMQIDLNIY